MVKRCSGRPLEPRISRDEARALFEKRRGILFRPRLGRLELIYFPVYIVEATVVDPKDGEVTPVHFVVDAIRGLVQRLDYRVPLASGGDGPTGVSFSNRIDRDAALARAREEIPWIILPISLKQNRRLPVEDFRVVEERGYPYWVQYLIRRRGYDFEAIDGFSGSRVGPKGRAVILDAIVGEKKSPRAPLDH